MAGWLPSHKSPSVVINRSIRGHSVDDRWQTTEIKLSSFVFIGSTNEWRSINLVLLCPENTHNMILCSVADDLDGAPTTMGDQIDGRE